MKHQLPATFIVGGVADLRQLVSGPLRFAPRNVAVSLRIEGLTDQESAHFERLLTRYRSACGCGAGAVGLLLLAAGYPLYAMFSSGLSGALSISNFVIWVALSVAGAGIGKRLGLSVAQMRLRGVAHELAERVEQLNKKHSLYRS